MVRRYQGILLSALIVSLFFILYLMMQIIKTVLIQAAVEESWLLRLCVNLAGYGCILIPGFVAYKYVKSTDYLERTDLGSFGRFVKLCLGDSCPDLPKSVESTSNPLVQNHSQGKRALQLLYCFGGLQTSYLIWGVLQEKIMTQASEYYNADDERANFKDSEFLVFVNRVLAFAFSGIHLMFTKHPRHNCPLYKYVYCSLTNILSSWCQYEALKFVTFPTQVLVKASKIIPVMIMGKVVSKKKFEYYEYVTAVMMSIGMIMFLLNNGGDQKGVKETTVSGIVLMAMYMTMDSFTSNWQSKLFSTYHMSSVQMMCGVNLFSCLFTAVSLVSQGSLFKSFLFMSKFPSFALDCFFLSLCSASGQLFIFYTIATFGPVVFVIITTLRQVFAILLSCIIYDHHLSALAAFGVSVVFIAIFLRIYCNQRLRNIRKQQLRNVCQG
ncbi:Adenosine 3'-phospho 5'-phosphosulfate transporter 1 [Frankliniella fusca]|uniref:Adenosine 3'-phospho 5'-phosphosulfate transporter 1 n=1 Tax=Frankliniella fusca TaxID=407009 RepID=A0AAE1HSR8_9NEOP|nr:Adenosine 3'-phospho 5'-phosphosulfate transporter 1 [Frankliniella fusca]